MYCTGIQDTVHSLFRMFAVEKMLVTGALPVAVKFKSGVLIYFSTLLFQFVSKDLPGSSVLFP